MEIETKRLLLRPFTAADGEDLYSYLSDPEVVRFEPYDVFTKAGAEKEAARRAGDPNFFAVVLKKTGHVIGNLYFAPSEYEKYECRDIWFRKDEAGAPIWQDTYIYGLLEEDLGK